MSYSIARITFLNTLAVILLSSNAAFSQNAQGVLEADRADLLNAFAMSTGWLSQFDKYHLECNFAGRESYESGRVSQGKIIYNEWLDNQDESFVACQVIGGQAITATGELRNSRREAIGYCDSSKRASVRVVDEPDGSVRFVETGVGSNLKAANHYVKAYRPTNLDIITFLPPQHGSRSVKARLDTLGHVIERVEGALDAVELVDHKVLGQEVICSKFSLSVDHRYNFPGKETDNGRYCIDVFVSQEEETEGLIVESKIYYLDSKLNPREGLGSTVQIRWGTFHDNAYPETVQSRNANGNITATYQLEFSELEDGFLDNWDAEYTKQLVAESHSTIDDALQR